METATFGKNEKLKSRKSIEALFRSGRSFSSPPFALLYRQAEHQLPAPLQMTVAVPRKNFKRAVDRNLIKRRTREAYRRNKTDLLLKIKRQHAFYEILFLYQATAILDQNTINKAVKILLTRLSSETDRPAYRK